MLNAAATQDSAPLVKDLVLVGGGHSHVFVLRHFAMRPLPGVRLTLICRDINTPYSGMLPGLIAGHYDKAQTHIDLGPLAQAARARFIHAEATALDLRRRLVHCGDRPPVNYDLLSLDVGSTPALAEVPGAAEHTIPVKPIAGLLRRWRQLHERLLAGDGEQRVAVVGGGAGSVELLLAAQLRLRQLSGPDDTRVQFALVTAAERLLPGYPRRVQARFERVLARRGVALYAGCRVSSVSAGRLHFAAGGDLSAEHILWVTQAAAPDWPGAAGLATDAAGFVQVDACLRSLSHPQVFAAGDIAAVCDHPRPKAGVFAVRQGPPLARNLRRVLCGQPPKPFVPQRQFLSLISTGDRYAVASRGRLSLAGRWVWRWKDRIDRRFIRRFTDLSELAMTASVQPTATPPEALSNGSPGFVDALRCGGCGAKVGAELLSRSLAKLEPLQRPDIVTGLAAGDDAAVLRVPAGKVLVQSVDFFRALVDDPYLFGQIAANHCLNDLFAMAAEPHSALAVVTVPLASEAKTALLLDELLAGAVKVLNAAGAALIGGHTGEGAELALGFSVNGLAGQNGSGALLAATAAAGDALILTKPLGTGVLFAAQMQLRARGDWIAAALAAMLRSNQAAAACLRRHGASGCTDVTGFGLAGHLATVLRRAGLAAELSLDALPLLAGARAVSEQGIVSSLYPQNIKLAAELSGGAEHNPNYRLLFDPQTAGGLLAGVAAERAAACLAELRCLGYVDAAIVGRVVGRAAGGPLIRLV